MTRYSLCVLKVPLNTNQLCVIPICCLFGRMNRAAFQLRLHSSDRRLLCINCLRLNDGEVGRRAACQYHDLQNC